jgi:hypothetical protein
MKYDCFRTGLPCLFAAALFLLPLHLFGALAGLVGLLIGWCPVWKRMKAPDVTVGVGFALMIIGILFFGERQMEPWRAFVIPTLLAAMAFGSVMVNLPFTVPYAKERSSPEMWVLPHFIVVNRILTVFWGFLFLGICFSLAGARHCGQVSRLLQWIVPAFLFVAGFKFTTWYPGWHEKKFVPSSRGRSS